jgi:hypothetical protein
MTQMSDSGWKKILFFHGRGDAASHKASATARVFEMNTSVHRKYSSAGSDKIAKLFRYQSLKAESANHSNETRMIVWFGRFLGTPSFPVVERDCEMASTPDF